MTTKFQALILAVLIIISVAATNIGGNEPETAPTEEKAASSRVSQGLTFQRASLFAASTPNLSQYEVKKAPERNWEVLDPKIGAEAVLIQSLDGNFPFFHLNTYKFWPLASLTKLLSAVVVIENIGENKKVVVDEAAVATDGEAGGLKSGEVYTARDLLKIMLFTSSNDAAAAFENYLGKDEFIRLMNEKLRELGMTQTKIYGASGLEDENMGTASDILRLAKYILEKEPQIFNWTRQQSQLVQPLNDASSRTILNINGMVDEPGFLGGKTGTSDKALENEVAIFSVRGEKLIVIILGSADRDKEIKNLLDWVSRAHTFPAQ